MTTDIDESLLLFGDDIYVEEINMYIRNPRIKDIRKLSETSILSKTLKISGFKIYDNYINLLCLEPADVADILWVDVGIWYKDISSFILFMIGCASDVISYIEALNWFTQKDFIYVDDEKLPYLYYLDDEGDMVKLSETMFNKISKTIKDINYVGEKERTNFKKESSEKAYLKKIRDKRNRIEKQTITLLSIISSIAWKSNLYINDLLEYSISQIYDGYFRINNIDNYDKTMLGIYSGNVDGNNIDMEKLNWSKVLI